MFTVFVAESRLAFIFLCVLDSFITRLGGLSLLILSYLAMASKFEGYLSSETIHLNRHPSDSVGSTTSIDSGYKSLSCTPSLPNEEYILGLADLEYQAAPSVSAGRIKKHPPTFQCTLCLKRFTRAYNLRSHLRTHTDERPFVCTVCGKAFARQYDRKRHEGLHSGEKKFVCKGELKQDGQWGCGRRFARADALGRHFHSEAGRICIKPLVDEEVIERQHRWQGEQRTEHNIPKKQELVSAFPVDESGNNTLPASLLAQYPALATLNWSELLPVDDGYDGGPSECTSFEPSGAEYYSDMDTGYIALQPSIKEEISEEPAATSPSKEPDTNIILEGDCVANISEKSEPKDSIDDNIEPPAIPEVKEEGQLVLDDKASFPSSTVSSNDEIDIKSKPLRDSAEPCTDVLTKVSEQAEERAREPNPTNNNRRTESLPHDEVSGDYDYVSAASTTESDFEDN